MFNTIISAAELNKNLTNSNWRIVDCRHDLVDIEAGRRAYNIAHIPGALFAHLDEDLSGPIVKGKTGRHPLPCVTAMERLFGHWGITPDTQVVVYDDKQGAIAARLWWMLRFVGHTAVAVLDGGFLHWEREGLPLSKDQVRVSPVDFKANVQSSWVSTADAVEQHRISGDYAVIDSRASARYRGEEEPIDPIAGHIPGAINMPFAENWRTDGLMESPAYLRNRFKALPTSEKLTFYCGSGVTACHNLLAYAHAGLGNARLYPGSWSEWITDEKRAVVKEG